MESVTQEVFSKARHRRNAGAWRGFVAPLSAFFVCRVCRHELISASLGLGRSALLGRWQKYGVDNVDHAVAAGDVGLGDVHVAIECYTTVGGYLQIGAVDRLRCFAV